MRSLIGFFARQGVFADLLTFFVLVLGIVSALTIRREVFPNVKFDIITITTIFPGASPSETEKLVTNPLEQDLKEVDGIKKMTSVSVDNRSLIVLQLDPDQTTEDEALDDVREIVDAFSDLPDGAEDPSVKSVESKESPVVEVSLAGDLPALELRAIARDMENEIEKLREVAKVVPNGYQDLEFRIEADLAKLSRYQLTLDDLIRAIRNKNVSIPGGVIEAATKNDLERVVRTIGDLESVEDVRNTVVRANELGNPIRVGDVARVVATTEKPASLLRTNGQPAIRLTVLKKEKADAIDLVDAVKERMETLGPDLLKKGVSVSFINDASYYIRRRLSILTNNLVVGLFLVFGVLSLILPVRVALIVGFGIPFAFLGTIALFDYGNFSLNMISMMGLIIVLGMLVDDAIVVMENGVRHIEEGDDPVEAAVRGTQEIWAPVTASVMTTVMVFVPMLFMSGIFGKFIRHIPTAVILALIISLLECFFILPHHMGRWIRSPKDRKPPTTGLQRFLGRARTFWDRRVTPAYVALLDKALGLRYLVAFGTGSLLVGTVLFAFFQMRVVLFPPDGVEVFFIRGEAPVGTSLERTAELTRPFEKLVATLPPEELQDFTTDIGKQAQDVNDPNTKRGGHYSQVTVYLTPEPNRDRSANEIIADLRERAGKPEGFRRVTFERVNPGPPVGKPISIGLRGKTYEDILPAAEEMRKRIGEWEGVSDLTDSYLPGKEEIEVRIKPGEAAAAGLTEGQVGTAVRSAFEGVVATSVRSLEEEIDVRVTLPEEDRGKESTLKNLRILSPSGAQVPLSRIARFSTTQGVAAYEHEENQRQVKVLGEVDNVKATATTVTQRVKEFLPEFRALFPKVEVFFGGEADDTKESLISLVRAFVLAIMGVMLILVMQFQRLDQPFVIILTIPLGVIAVLWAFFFNGLPITFMGGLGLVALAGVIVNNAIVFMDFVNKKREEGSTKRDSILEAASLRVRPIFLTTVTTVAGILPTAYGIGGLDKFVVPVAMALGWGMFFGSVLATFVFPCAVCILDDITDLASRMLDRVRGRSTTPAH